VGSVPAECAPDVKYYMLANVHDDAGGQIWPTSTVQHQLFVEGTQLKLASSSSGGSVLLSLDGLTVSKVSPEDDEAEAEDDTLAEVHYSGYGLKGRICHFGPEWVRFQWDEVGNNGYIAKLADRHDGNGVLLCTPLTSTSILGALVGVHGKLQKAIAIQIEPHGVLRAWTPKAGDETRVSLAGVWYSPHTVASAARATMFPCVPRCFPGTVGNADELPAEHSCIKLCAPARTTADDGCSCIALKRIQCTPIVNSTDGGVSCGQYKELLAEMPANGCSTQCARQLGAF